MTNLINWHILSIFYDNPKLENIANILKTLDLLFKLEKKMAAQVAAMFVFMGLIHAYILSVMCSKLIPRQL